MTFYIALPLYVWLTDRMAHGKPARSWVPAEIALLVVLSLWSIGLQVFTKDDLPALIGGSFLSYWLWFALGMGLAIASVAVGERRGKTVASLPIRTPGAFWLAAIALYVLLVFALPPVPFLFDDQLLLAFIGLAGVAVLLLIPAITTSSEAGFPGRVLAARAIKWCGLVSYGVFLWHIVVIRVLIDSFTGWTFLPLLLATITISLAVAAASYYVLERPILRFKR